MLHPATQRRMQGRAWIYLRDDRPFCGLAAPAVAFFYSEHREREQQAEHLRRFAGFLQTDGRALRKGDDPERVGIVEVACWARCRTKFCDIWGATQSEVAWEALERIAAIYAIDARARQKPADGRVALRAEARPLVDTFFAWSEAAMGKLYAGSALAEAFRYTLARRRDLSLFLDNGCPEIDNRPAETVLARYPDGRTNLESRGRRRRRRACRRHLHADRFGGAERSKSANLSARDIEPHRHGPADGLHQIAAPLD